MKYPTKVLKNAQNILTARRNEYKRLSKENKDRIYRQNPKLKVLNSTIAATIKNALGNGLTSSEIKETVENLTDMRQSILKSSGLGENCLDNIYYCKKCADEGFSNDEICDCYAKIIKEEAYKISNLGDKIKSENFETFNFELFNNKKEIEFIYNAVKKFCEFNLTNKKNLVFIGSTGTGKTFMSSCIAKYFLDNHKSVLYMTAAKISNLIDEAKFNKSEQSSENIEFIIDCDLLIIDDLGIEFPLPYAQSQLFDILETRQLREKRTVISTNLKPDALTQKYSARFTSRLLGNYEILIFSGVDLRYNKVSSTLRPEIPSAN